MSDYVDAYGFHFLDMVAPEMINLHGVGLEERTQHYFYNNNERDGNAWLLQYTLEGKGVVFVGDKSFEITPETSFLVSLPSDSSYGILRNRQWRFIWLMFSGEMATKYANHITGQFGSKLSFAKESKAFELLGQIHAQAKAGILCDGLRAQEMVYRFLCQLTRALCKNNAERQTLVKMAQEMIAKEYRSLQGVSEVARRLNVSAEHLSRAFASQTGATLMETLTQNRIKQAVQLLLNSHLDIETIAYECGYLNGNYFGKVFKKVMGVSPAAFRNEVKIKGYSDVLI